jgi:hypothetical protein
MVMLLLLLDVSHGSTRRRSGATSHRVMVLFVVMVLSKAVVKVRMVHGRQERGRARIIRMRIADVAAMVMIVGVFPSLMETAFGGSSSAIVAGRSVAQD